MTKRVTFLLFVFFTSVFNTVFAYQPSIESLFRNVSNEEVEGKTVLANIIFEKIDSEENTENQDTLSSNLLPKQFATKLIFGNMDKTVKFAQINYDDLSFSKSKIKKVINRNDVNLLNLGLSPENIDGKLLYAVLASLLNNDGSWMIQTLKSLGSNIKSNNELINNDKISLLNNYKKYLKLKAEDEESNEIVNPLKSTVLEDQKILNETLKASFYRDSEKVKMIKDRNYFYWLVKDSYYEAKFSHEKRQIKSLEVNTSLGNVEFYFKDFILQNSTHEFPKEIIFKTLSGDKYKILLRKLTIIDDSENRYDLRIKKYKDSVDLNNNSKKLSPSFFI